MGRIHKWYKIKKIIILYRNYKAEKIITRGRFGVKVIKGGGRIHKGDLTIIYDRIHAVGKIVTRARVREKR